MEHSRALGAEGFLTNTTREQEVTRAEDRVPVGHLSVQPSLVILQARFAFQDDDLAEFTVTIRLVSVLASHVIFQNVNSDERFITDGAFVLQL